MRVKGKSMRVKRKTMRVKRKMMRVKRKMMRVKRKTMRVVKTKKVTKLSLHPKGYRMEVRSEILNFLSEIGTTFEIHNLKQFSSKILNTNFSSSDLLTCLMKNQPRF